MKKALQISIAQTLFVIEEDAYAKLDAYLASIRAHFARTEGSAEIVADIEARVSEQFQETKKNVITLADVEAVIASMGTVADFGEEEPSAQAEPTTGAKKKAYRNPNDKIVAGVCSGLAAYVNVDVLWMRIGFVLFTVVSNGFGILLYLILALIIPEAKTASQKLEMEGSPVTLETMSETFKEQMEEVREQHGSRVKEVLSWPFIALKRVVEAIVRFVVPTARVTLGVFLACVCLAAALGISILAPFAVLRSDALVGFSLPDIVSPFVLYAVIAGAYLAVMLPLAVAFLLGVAIVRRRRPFTAALGFTLLALWCAAVVVGGVAASWTVDRVRAYARENPLYEMSSLNVPVAASLDALVVGGKIRATFVQGEEAGVSVAGTTEAVRHLLLEEREGAVRLATDDRDSDCLFCGSSDTLEATITLPSLRSADVLSGASFVADAWTSAVPVEIAVREGARAEVVITAPSLRAVAEESSRAMIDADASSIELTARQGSRVTWTGTAAAAVLMADEWSRMDASGALMDTVSATASQGSEVLLGRVRVGVESAIETFGGLVERFQDSDSE